MSNPIQQAISAFEEIIAAGKAAKEALDKDIPVGDPVHPVSGRLTWPLSSCLLALDALQSLQGVELPEPFYTEKSSFGWPDLWDEAGVRTAVAAALGRGVVPSGWKLVPVEPTPEMRKAAADAWLDCDSKLFLNKAGAAVRAAIAISKESA